MTTKDELKQRVMAVLETLPDEALEEVALFLDYQRHKLARNRPGYEPVALGGLWAGVRIGDEDIDDIRRDMWGRFTDSAP